MMTAYYNEIDPYAAEWLRNLIEDGHIAPGVVDERSIEDVRPSDLKGFTQCHFFAGIGIWSHALRSAGWKDSRPVWTGSCPCQPFSAAGRGKGTADERHLWPAWHWLIQECRPPVVLGEQVASPSGRAWFDTVQADLEGVGYASAAFDLCAAGFGAPHIRQRLYFAAQGLEYAYNKRTGRYHRTVSRSEARRIEGRQAAWGIVDEFDDGSAAGGVADGERTGLEGYARDGDKGNESRRQSAQQTGPAAESSDAGDGSSPLNGFWRAADWLHCRDGKWRPVEPGTFPLADGAPSRVGRLRAYGNGIVAPQATEFVRAIMG